MSSFYKKKFGSAIFIPILSIVSSLSAAAFLLLLPFDGIEFNGDSFVYFSNAKDLSESITTGKFPEPKHWPYGYPALLSIAFVVGDTTFESARWVNVLTGGVLTALFCVMLLTLAQLKKLSNKHTLLILLSAGLWPLAHGYFLKYQLAMMSDISAALWGTLMILSCWRWRISGSLSAIIFAGIALGLAVFTRYVYALMVIPALVIILSDTDWKNTASVKKHMGTTILFGITALFVFTPQLFLTLSDLSHSLGNDLFQSWKIKNFFTLIHESVDGHQTASIPNVLYYILLPFQWKCFTPFGFLMIMAGIMYAVRELPKWVWLSLAAWFMIMYLLVCGIPIQNARIGFPLFFPLLIFISLGLLECLLRWKKYFQIVLMANILIWFISLIFSFKYISEYVKAKNELKETGDSIAKYIPKNSYIISTSLYAVYLAYPSAVEPYSIYTITIPEAQKLINSGKPIFLAIDEDRFNKQWTDHLPGKHYKWIKDHYTCKQVLKVREYTVYQINPI